jgi:hypothetical protein
LVAINLDRYGWLIVDKKGRSARKEIEEIRISDLKGPLRVAGEGSIYVKKPRETRSTGALNHRQDDEDAIMDHADFECLSWKEILSLIDDYYKVNSFLVQKSVLKSPNYILPKAMYYIVFRYVICQDIASGRRGRMAIERQVEIKSA